jgi:hypothetical protein
VIFKSRLLLSATVAAQFLVFVTSGCQRTTHVDSLLKYEFSGTVVCDADCPSDLRVTVFHDYGFGETELKPTTYSALGSSFVVAGRRMYGYTHNVDEPRHEFGDKLTIRVKSSQCSGYQTFLRSKIALNPDGDVNLAIGKLICA